jgi:hypothetical protein
MIGFYLSEIDELAAFPGDLIRYRNPRSVAQFLQPGYLNQAARRQRRAEALRGAMESRQTAARIRLPYGEAICLAQQFFTSFYNTLA